jgi:hypothetical protein
VNASLAELARALERVADITSEAFQHLDLGHDDRVLLRDVHDTATRFACQVEALARRTRA